MSREWEVTPWTGRENISISRIATGEAKSHPTLYCCIVSLMRGSGLAKNLTSLVPRPCPAFLFPCSTWNWKQHGPGNEARIWPLQWWFCGGFGLCLCVCVCCRESNGLIVNSWSTCTSGVTSRLEKPVPPVVRMRSNFCWSLHCKMVLCTEYSNCCIKCLNRSNGLSTAAVANESCTQVDQSLSLVIKRCYSLRYNTNWCFNSHALPGSLQPCQVHMLWGRSPLSHSDCKGVETFINDLVQAKTTMTLMLTGLHSH